MASNIDDKELARLAQLSADHEMPEIIGALVAEVRRLRDKVEAWEWYEECRKCLEWLYETCCSSTPFREAEATYLAAREAIC